MENTLHLVVAEPDFTETEIGVIPEPWIFCTQSPPPYLTYPGINASRLALPLPQDAG